MRPAEGMNDAPLMHAMFNKKANILGASKRVRHLPHAGLGITAAQNLNDSSTLAVAVHSVISV